MFDSLVGVVGPDHSLQLLGVRMLGFNATTARKLLLTVAFFILIKLIALILRAFARAAFRGRDDVRSHFWSRQAVQLVTTILVAVALVSVWFDNPARFGGAIALVTAGVAVALQKVITSIAAYFVILRGKVFNIGDRITMGGVRGDVISLGYIRTTIMEMGEPPEVQDAEPAMWVEARQYTGRIVSVTNDTIFDKPVYNFSRDFPFLWEEIHLPIRYADDNARAEKILLEAVKKHSIKVEEMSRESLEELKRRYFIRDTEVEPRVYFRLTDNWIEMSARFVTHVSGIRAVKDAISREILAGLREAKIEVASSTYEIVGLPELKLMPPDPGRQSASPEGV